MFAGCWRGLRTLRMKLEMREEIKGRYDLSYEQREDEAWVIRIKRK